MRASHVSLVTIALLGVSAIGCATSTGDPGGPTSTVDAATRDTAISPQNDVGADVAASDETSPIDDTSTSDETSTFDAATPDDTASTDETIVADDASTAETASVDAGAPDTSTDDASTPDVTIADTSTPDTTPIVDTAVPDTAVPDTAVPDTAVPDTTTPDTGSGTVVVGGACTTDGDCAGGANGYCSGDGTLYAVGALDPTPICVQVDLTSGAADVCNSDATTAVPYCDSNHGFCSKSGTDPATCEGLCVYGADGSVTTSCTGSNACVPQLFDGSGVTYGVCEGGCEVDSDCPSGNACDPVEKICTRSCTSASDCSISGETHFVCDSTSNHCAFDYPSALGAACTQTADTCLCLQGTSDAGGACATACTTGGAACATGYVCDPLVPTTYAPNWTSMPSGLAGYCVKTCTKASNCQTGQSCTLSAGQTKKTCQPSAS